MRGSRAREVRVGEGRRYDLVLSPVITEKSTQGSEHNQITFRVPLDASKPEIKAAVEGLFKVKVETVNTLRQRGKVKRFRVEGEIIDVTSKI